MSGANADRPTCKTCPFWRQSRYLEGDEGYCHGSLPRPALMGKGAGEGKGGEYVCWPVTIEDEFCPAHPDFSAYLAARKPANPAATPTR